MPSITEAATQFVGFVLENRYKEWNKATELLVEEKRIFLEILSFGGFGVRNLELEIVPGCIEEYPSGNEHFVPSHSVFIVIDQEGNECPSAVKWLSTMMYNIGRLDLSERQSREKIIEIVVEKIGWTIPFKPIQLTSEGDLLGENLPENLSPGRQFYRHTQDSSKLESPVGIHLYCNGSMERRGATVSCDAVVCRGCFFAGFVSKRS